MVYSRGFSTPPTEKAKGLCYPFADEVSSENHPVYHETKIPLMYSILNHKRTFRCAQRPVGLHQQVSMNTGLVGPRKVLVPGSQSHTVRNQRRHELAVDKVTGLVTSAGSIVRHRKTGCRASIFHRNHAIVDRVRSN